MTSLVHVNAILDAKLGPYQNVINGVVNYMASPYFRLTRMKRPSVKDLVIVLETINYSKAQIKAAKNWEQKAHLVMMWLKKDKSPIGIDNIVAKSVASQYENETA